MIVVVVVAGQTSGSHVAVYTVTVTGTVQEASTAMILLQRVQTATDLIQVRGHWIKLQHCIKTRFKWARRALG